MSNHPLCTQCYSDTVSPKRVLLGYTVCLSCGEANAERQSRLRTVVPMNKSNYILVSDLSILKQLNPKRTT